MQARISDTLKPWQKGRRRYTDHIEVADAFLLRIGARHGDPVHRLVEWVIAAEPISHDAAVKRMRDYRKFGRQEDLDAVLAPLMWAAMRPLMNKPIYDDVFQDAFQESMLAIIDYLRGMDLDPVENWRTLRAYPAMSARRHTLLDTICLARPARSRADKKLHQAFERKGASIDEICNEASWAILEDDLDAPQRDLLEEMRDFIAGGADGATAHVDPWQDLEAEQDLCATPRCDLRIDLMHLLDWATKTLDPRQIAVLHGRLLDPDEPSLEEIASPHGLTGERMRQIYRDALVILREAWQTDLHHKVPARPKPQRRRGADFDPSSLNGFRAAFCAADRPRSIAPPTQAPVAEPGPSSHPVPPILKGREHDMTFHPPNQYPQNATNEDSSAPQIPAPILDAARSELSHWLDGFLQSDTMVDLIAGEAPSWARQMLGESLSSEIADAIRRQSRPGFPARGQGSYPYEERILDWPENTTHRLQVHNLVAYGHHDPKTNHMTLLPGTMLMKGWPDVTMGRGYSLAYAALRLTGDLFTEEDGLLRLRQPVVVAGPAAAAALVCGSGAAGGNWKTSSGDKPPTKGRAKPFRSGLLVDLAVSEADAEAWCAKAKVKNPDPEISAGASARTPDRFLGKVVADFTESSDPELNKDTPSAKNGDLAFSTQAQRTAGSYPRA